MAQMRLGEKGLRTVRENECTSMSNEGWPGLHDPHQCHLQLTLQGSLGNNMQGIGLDFVRGRRVETAFLFLAHVFRKTLLATFLPLNIASRTTFGTICRFVGIVWA